VKKGVTVGVVAVFFIIVFLMLGPLWTLQEGEQAVLLQFGRIVATHQEAGLKLKTPVIDRVVKFPQKILSWDGAAQRIPTEENQFIWVDTTARWRITNPKLFYESVTSTDQAASRLDDIIDSEVRKIISRNPLTEAVRNSDVINEIERRNVFATVGADSEIDDSVIVDTFTQVTYPSINKGRTELSDEVLTEASRLLIQQFGIELIDVVIRQIKYSDDLTESVYNRMIADRQQIAQAFRSDGEGQKADWLGRRSRELNVVLSAARRRAEEIKGDADAQAANIYAEAYNQDPEFYEFWKAVEAYRMLMPKFRKTLTTDAEFFKYLYNQEGRLGGP
jgi:membrane protease subunit HflC